MSELFGDPLLQRVWLAGLLASVACGVVGTFVVARRIASITGGIAHAAFGGVGLGYWLGVSPLLGAAGFGVLAGLVVGVASRRVRDGLDTWIAIVWSVGMALGLVFIALAPGYAPDLTSYLFGSLLYVSREFILAVLALDVVLLVGVALCFKELQAVAFDEEYAGIAGLPVERLFLVMLALTALTVVTLIRVVGVILAIALITIPAAAARPWVDGLGRMMVLATAFAATCTTAGLLTSYALSAAGVSLPPGPLIVLMAAVLYATSWLAARVRSTPANG